MKVKNGVPKIRFFLLLAFASVLAFTSCAYTPHQRYDNFITDLDVITRMDICFDIVSGGGTDLYTREELNTIAEDLSVWDVEYQAATDANYLLTKSALYLVICMDYNKESDQENAAMILKMARGFYGNARAIINTME